MIRTDPPIFDTFTTPNPERFEPGDRVSVPALGSYIVGAVEGSTLHMIPAPEPWYHWLGLALCCAALAFGSYWVSYFVSTSVINYWTLEFLR